MEMARSDELAGAMVEIARLTAAVEAVNLQTQLALESAEKLELERIRAVQQRLDVAADERASAAEVLRDELHRTALAATDEREKSAAALRAGTDLQFAALKEQFTALVHAKSDEFQAVHTAAERAVEKQEVANQLWREQANEWRGQSADRERSQQESLAVLVATFLPRETFDSVILGWTSWREQIDSRLNRQQGAAVSTERRESRMQPWQIWAAGTVLTIVITFVVILANVLTTAPTP